MAVAAGTGHVFPTLTFVLTGFAMVAVFGLAALQVVHEAQRPGSHAQRTDTSAP